MAGGAIGGEVVLPRLDVVFGLAAGAIEPFVEVLGAAAFQVGDNEAGIGSFGPGFNPRDDALHPAPALRGIVELHETAHLAAVRRHPGLRRGRLLGATAGGIDKAGSVTQGRVSKWAFEFRQTFGSIGRQRTASPSLEPGPAMCSGRPESREGPT